MEAFYRTRAEDDHIELCYSGFTASLPDVWDFMEKTVSQMLKGVADGYIREITREECPVADNERGPLYPYEYIPDDVMPAGTDNGT